MICEYVNLLFLFDINAFVFSVQEIRSERSLLRGVFDAIGRIDAAQSTARWRKSLPHWSAPAFSAPKKEMMVEAVYHPLLHSPVSNSMHLCGTGALITGSNMAGKTTFMKAMGVNAILAQTLNTVCARSWNAPPVIVRTSIERNENLLDGKNHYLAEVESIRSLLQASDTTSMGQHLFLTRCFVERTLPSESLRPLVCCLTWQTEAALCSWPLTI